MHITVVVERSNVRSVHGMFEASTNVYDEPDQNKPFLSYLNYHLLLTMIHILKFEYCHVSCFLANGIVGVATRVLFLFCFILLSFFHDSFPPTCY